MRGLRARSEPSFSKGTEKQFNYINYIVYPLTYLTPIRSSFFWVLGLAATAQMGRKSRTEKVAELIQQLQEQLSKLINSSPLLKATRERASEEGAEELEKGPRVCGKKRWAGAQAGAGGMSAERRDIRAKLRKGREPRKKGTTSAKVREEQRWR